MTLTFEQMTSKSIGFVPFFFACKFCFNPPLEIQVKSKNDISTKKSIFSYGDLDNWPINLKINWGSSPSLSPSGMFPSGEGNSG